MNMEEKKFETAEFEKLIQTRQNQLAHFRNIPNELEVVWEKDGQVILNNSVSFDIESALEAISAVKERIVWITEMEYAEINFHGILGGLLDRLDMIIHIGETNPLQHLGKAAVSATDLEEALRLAKENLNENSYVVYAPAKLPEKSVKDRGTFFRNCVKEYWK